MSAELERIEAELRDIKAILQRLVAREAELELESSDFVQDLRMAEALNLDPRQVMSKYRVTGQVGRQPKKQTKRKKTSKQEVFNGL